ncbi:MAG: DoxX family protein [Jatrophihabitantaceae bacterium]
MTDATADPTRRRRANGWPVLPLRIYLAAVFLFAGYAKLVYPHFLDPNATRGFRAAVTSAKHGTPLGSLLNPLADHTSLFGHLTAFAEIAIGLGLLVGLLTRAAALGGMVLLAMIVLSIDWNSVKEYTGSTGWFASGDLALGVALSVFVIGGADKFSLDAIFWRSRLRRQARDDAEPGFRDNELAESRARLQGQPYPDGPDTERLPVLEENSLWNDGRDEPADYGPDARETRRVEPVRAEDRERG